MRRIDSISGLLLLLASVIIIFIAYAGYIYSSYKTYIVAEGEVVAVKSGEHGRGNASVGKLPLLRVSGTVVSYEYYVNASQYSGIGRIKGGDTLKSGEIIEVFYDPKKPKNSTLEKKFNWAYFGALFLFLIVLLLAERRWHKLRLRSRKALTNQPSSTR